MGALNSLQQNVEEGWRRAALSRLGARGGCPDWRKEPCPSALSLRAQPRTHLASSEDEKALPPGFSALHQHAGKEGVWKGKMLCTNQMGLGTFAHLALG